ncbi:PQQ-binding-like beta-propeller repeat protein [Streptomyces sp. SID5643]|uniref:PQQ-binding-like beta-propeller repeat protein n=1 Tax=Streptomyces sp. SID5643 TaxID=2690307 RepID=UPI001369EDAE|nr:PQQ-binding-like beta-propeller repeat protein [Streptomyces sp. SID5643]MZF86644.1 PQQ-binding-like beta-propeller repeat protein [Streptomyces sp. SID5643]
MLDRTNVIPWAPAALAAISLLTTSCASHDDTASAPKAASSASAPHGYVEGAQEKAEQQSRLLLNDPATGGTRVLDLITGTTHKVSRATGTTDLTTDGRFGYFHAADGIHVLDGGAWMVDHGDHVHYYRAAIRDVGRMPGGPGTRVRSDAAVTAVTDEEGRARIYRRAGLEQGEVGPARRLPGRHAGAVVPYAEHLLSVTEDGKVMAYDRQGERSASPDQGCETPRGDAVTRRGVVLGCADGALLVREDDGTFTAEKIPYGSDVPEAERATAFRHRPGSDTLTAPAGKRAVWVLDVGERTWARVKTGPVVSANTAGEGSVLVVLETDGALHGYDIATGKQVSKTKRLVTGSSGTGTDKDAPPVIEVDRSRAYLNDPKGKRVYEIDYNDNLRLARTFDLDIEPALMAETGR